MRHLVFSKLASNPPLGHKRHSTILLVSLFHLAVRNSRVYEFFPVSLVSQICIELQRMRLGVQEEIADVF